MNLEFQKTGAHPSCVSGRECCPNNDGMKYIKGSDGQVEFIDPAKRAEQLADPKRTITHRVLGFLGLK